VVVPTPQPSNLHVVKSESDLVTVAVVAVLVQNIFSDSEA
jgi:hypothetical protein